MSMTMRVFRENVVNGVTNDEQVAFAQAALAQLDKSNEARRVKAAEKAVEREAAKAPIREAIVAVITDEPKTATTLIEDAGLDIKPQSIPSLLKGLVQAGVIQKTPIKIKNKGSQVGYIKA